MVIMRLLRVYYAVIVQLLCGCYADIMRLLCGCYVLLCSCYGRKRITRDLFEIAVIAALIVVLTA